MLAPVKGSSLRAKGAPDSAYLIDVTRQSEAVRSPPSEVLRAVRALTSGPWLLAVSGGRDSMVLMDAVGRIGRGDVRAVATFDHGTGPAATDALSVVERAAAEQGFRFIGGRASRAAVMRTEAQWRRARWRFLTEHAGRLRATVVTAHTRDDQVETVALRILRGAGTRGLAGMSARSAGPPPVMRPLLDVSRSAIDRHVAEFGIAYIDDPSNAARRHARNRMRHDLLPALERAAPGFREWLLDLSARARVWRESTEALAAGLHDRGVLSSLGDGSLFVRAAPLSTLGPREWEVLWPVLAAQAGLTLDRRGIARASTWSARAAREDDSRGIIQLAGGGSIERVRGGFLARRPVARLPDGNAADPTPAIY